MKRLEKKFHAQSNQKKTEVAILISDETDFRSKTYKTQRMTLYNDKGVSSPKLYNNYMCTEQQSSKIYEANINRTEGRIDCSTVTAGDFNTHFI